MKYGEWTLGQTEALLNKLGGTEVAFGILRGTIEVVTRVVSFIVGTFMILVDETKSVEELVKDGKFDWSNDNITSQNFPKPASGQKSKRKVVLFHFNKNMSSEAVIAEMDKASCEPATIWDLLGLAAKEPDLQREFPIVALKSVWRHPDGNLSVPALYCYAGGRILYLDCFEFGWREDYRFLGRRKYQK